MLEAWQDPISDITGSHIIAILSPTLDTVQQTATVNNGTKRYMTTTSQFRITHAFPKTPLSPGVPHTLSKKF